MSFFLFQGNQERTTHCWALYRTPTSTATSNLTLGSSQTWRRGVKVRQRSLRSGSWLADTEGGGFDFRCGIICKYLYWDEVFLFKWIKNGYVNLVLLNSNVIESSCGLVKSVLSWWWYQTLLIWELNMPKYHQNVQKMWVVILSYLFT